VDGDLAQLFTISAINILGPLKLPSGRAALRSIGSRTIATLRRSNIRPAQRALQAKAVQHE
jgi:hypothetical protein